MDHLWGNLGGALKCPNFGCTTPTDTDMEHIASWDFMGQFSTSSQSKIFKNSLCPDLNNCGLLELRFSLHGRSGLSLAHWTSVSPVIVRANATTTTLLAKVPCAVVRANATTTTLLAKCSLAVMVAKIQVYKNIQVSGSAIQRHPRTSLPQNLPAGMMAIKQNQSVYFSVSRMLPEPGGADMFHTVGAFQQDNLLWGLVDCWQTPDALIGTIYTINSGRPTLPWQP